MLLMWAVSAALNQRERSVAFISRSLGQSELHYPSAEKEATAIIEAVRKWRRFLRGRHFALPADQQSVSFMSDNHRRTKVKNNKIKFWRLELASFSKTRMGAQPIHFREVVEVAKISARQLVCTVHPRMHLNMRGVHHYKGASQTCHTKQVLLNFLLAKMNR